MAKKTEDPAIETTTPAPDAEVAAEPGLVTRVKTSATELKVRAEDIRDDLEGRRQSNRMIDAAFGSFEHESRVGGGILAGAVAFRFFLFVVPYVFVMVVGFGLGSRAAGEDAVDLARRTGIVGLASTAIKAGSEASTFSQILTFLVALYALISGSRKLVKSLNIVHALIWGVPLRKVPKLFPKALLAVALITGVLAAGALINSFKRESVVIWILALILTLFVEGGAWLLCTLKAFPSAPGVTWRDLWQGALLFALGVQGLHVVTIVWISKSLESKSETYGALGAALTILLWAYFLGRLVTASASLSAVLWADKQARAQGATGPDYEDVAAEMPSLEDQLPALEAQLAPPSSPFAPPRGPAAGTVAIPDGS